MRYSLKINCIIYSIDATKPDGRLGRLVNDSATPNCVVKKVVVHSLPHLCLFALKDITFGTELRYDYGVKDLPWRMKLPKVILSTSFWDAMNYCKFFHFSKDKYLLLILVLN